MDSWTEQPQVFEFSQWTLTNGQYYVMASAESHVTCRDGPSATLSSQGLPALPVVCAPYLTSDHPSQFTHMHKRGTGLVAPCASQRRQGRFRRPRSSSSRCHASLQSVSDSTYRIRSRVADMFETWA